MIGMKRIVKEYFTFSKKERVAVILLLLLIVIFIILPYLFPTKKPGITTDKELIRQVAKLQQNNPRNTNDKNDESGQYYQQSTEKTVLPYETFMFDPNTISGNDWKRLGINDKTIRTILNYREKGGKFRNPEDIRKIWGLKKEDADRIIPFAKVAVTSYQPAYYSRTYKQAAIPKPYAAKASIDINTASPEQLLQIPGIDHFVPYRIIRFRDKLGSFWNLQQVKQTYGMSDSVYNMILPYLKIDTISIKKININSCTITELNREPFISRDIAQAIIIYRNHHGNYQKPDDVKKIAFLTEETFQKIKPYITVQ